MAIFMIISASRRTDVPACHSRWFMNRFRDGYVNMRNPFNHSQVKMISILPDAAECFVFWTKNPLPFLPYLDELDGGGCKYYFQFTLTPYGLDLERGLPPKTELIKAFEQLSKRVGRERVIWRYDPILFWQAYDEDFHRRAFGKMCGLLAPYTDTVTISFFDMYPKLRSTGIVPPDEDAAQRLAGFIGKTSADEGIRAVACCEKGDYSSFGIGRAACIDANRIARLTGLPANSFERDKNQRTGCGCVKSVDIGAYGTCANGCLYCYANAGRKKTRASDPDSDEM